MLKAVIGRFDNHVNDGLEKRVVLINSEVEDYLVTFLYMLRKS